MSGYRFFLILVILIAVDYGVWLSWALPRIYTPVYISMGIPWKPNLLAAVLSWVCIAIGIYTFVPPSKSCQNTFILGCILGFVIYGTYDFTTLSVLSSYPWETGLLDIVWGTLLCGVTALLSRFILPTRYR